MIGLAGCSVKIRPLRTFSNTSGNLTSGGVISLSQNYGSVDENGVTVGSELAVTRTFSGFPQTVTVSIDAISAGSSQITLGDQTVHFAAGDLSVPLSNVLSGMATDGVVKGDTFVRARLSAPSDSGTLGATSEAQLNVIDNDLPGTFFFPKSLYSANESDGTAAVVVSRSGNLAAAASVQVTFIAGTAAAATDFVAAPITLTFGAGVSEATAFVPIVARAGYQANRSFYVELGTPSAGTSLRPWATAKVRILDSEDATTCDGANDNLAVNLGFGGGAGTSGDPYRICSLSQLYRVRANLTAFFRLMADLDLDPSLDADPTTPGVQPFTPITGTLSGGFNGDEHVLKNFRYTQTAGSGTPVGFIQTLGGNATASVSALNFMQVYLVSTSAGVHLGGIVGQTGVIGSMRDNHFSGYLESSGAGSLGGILNRSTDTIASAFTRNFVHGTLKNAATGDGGGIMAGTYDGTTTATQVADYSVATVDVGGEAGGLIGTIDAGGFFGIAASISNSHAKGRVNGGDAGGLVGVMSSPSGGDTRVSGSFATGPVTSPGFSGGLIGSFGCGSASTASQCDITNSYATGNVSRSTVGAGVSTGGLIGGVYVQTNVTISQVSAYGNVAGGDRVAGLIGLAQPSGSSTTLTIDHAHAYGNVASAAAPSSGVGGLINAAQITAGTNNSLVISNSSASGESFGDTTASYGSGGLIANLTSNSAGAGNSITVTNCTASGDVHGYINTGGLVGSIDAETSAGTSVTISLSTATGNLLVPNAGARFAGGAIGYGSYGSASGTDQSSITLDHLMASGNINTPGMQVGGLVGGFYVDAVNTTTTITNSSATGTIVASTVAGGLIGYYESRSFLGATATTVIDKVHASGNVTTTGEQAGGLFGSLGCTSSGTKTIAITRSYATGNASALGFNGGFAANLYAFNVDCSVSIANSYSSGTSSGAYNSGGFVGYTATTGTIGFSNTYTSSLATGGTAYNYNGFIGQPDTSTVSNSYWLKDVAINAGQADDGSQKTVSAMQTTATYSGWDFATIWNAPSAGVYPTLR
jgi:hypothetical protein